jgi:hypothetical protein
LPPGFDGGFGPLPSLVHRPAWDWRRFRRRASSAGAAIMGCGSGSGCGAGRASTARVACASRCLRSFRRSISSRATGRHPSPELVPTSPRGEGCRSYLANRRRRSRPAGIHPGCRNGRPCANSGLAFRGWRRRFGCGAPGAARGLRPPRW